jgi:hypothetical protein
VTAVYAGPPAESGVVLRENDIWGYVLVDQEAGLLLAAGFDPRELCADNFNLDVVTALAVYVPPPKDGHGLILGEVRASVWDFAQFNCDFFLAMSPLAEGMASIMFGQTNGFKNYRHTYKGMLYDPMTNEPIRMHAKMGVHFDGENYLIRVAKIRLN